MPGAWCPGTIPGPPRAHEPARRDRLHSFFRVQGEAHAALWDDAIHPSPAGYGRMGDVIYEAIRQHGL